MKNKARVSCVSTDRDLRDILKERVLEEITLHREIAAAEASADRVLSGTIDVMHSRLLALIAELETLKTVVEEWRGLQEARDLLVERAADTATLEITRIGELSEFEIGQILTTFVLSLSLERQREFSQVISDACRRRQ